MLQSEVTHLTHITATRIIRELVVDQSTFEPIIMLMKSFDADKHTLKLLQVGC